MKYYLVITQNDSTQAIFAFDTDSEALSRFHSELAYRGAGREKTMCIILDSYGNTVKREVWELPVEYEDDPREDE